jgi:hypothetical protein
MFDAVYPGIYYYGQSGRCALGRMQWGLLLPPMAMRCFPGGGTHRGSGTQLFVVVVQGWTNLFLIFTIRCP